MCNAWNHDASCDCGFGGDTGGGLVAFSSYHQWSLTSHRHNLVYLTTCWWCGADVYFFKDERGGCALFDDLGAPWQVHPCWDDNREERRAAIAGAETSMHTDGFTGRYYEEDYPLIAPPARARFVRPFWGVIVGIDIPLHLRALRNMGHHMTEAILCTVHVLVEGERYAVTVLERMTSGLSNGSPVRVSARWVHHSAEPVLYGFAVSTVDVSGSPLFRARWAAMAAQHLACALCGVKLNTGHDWTALRSGQLECEVCHELRGEYTPRAFVRHCRRVARHSRVTDGRITER